MVDGCIDYRRDNHEQHTCRGVEPKSTGQKNKSGGKHKQYDTLEGRIVIPVNLIRCVMMILQ